jgi:hypothetical protein
MAWSQVKSTDRFVQQLNQQTIDCILRSLKICTLHNFNCRVATSGLLIPSALHFERVDIGSLVYMPSTTGIPGEVLNIKLFQFLVV